MKNLKLFLAVLGISMLTSFSANATDFLPTSNTKKALSNEMATLIGRNIPVKVLQEFATEISFMVNHKNEIVIVDVASKNKELSTFIKNTLNYKKISTKNVKNGEVYRLPLRVKKSL
ncbi:hypothetical protein P8625_03470 [Tenacibaculum tangerinum]|uniref:Uncharacterized protein n=1 Tax=Tenacibaculum tangerinum TaxID=3038772 RepID=A0ABY8L481_9FLAO|nr:hypothetical protein [Tenacibaculum tangerinum]WGH76238.1 hypothetical protein P8625_03470 [Tenacibaculum tangerinum]